MSEQMKEHVLKDWKRNDTFVCTLSSKRFPRRFWEHFSTQWPMIQPILLTKERNSAPPPPPKPWDSLLNFETQLNHLLNLMYFNHWISGKGFFLCCYYLRYNRNKRETCIPKKHTISSLALSFNPFLDEDTEAETDQGSRAHIWPSQNL